MHGMIKAERVKALLEGAALLEAGTIIRVLCESIILHVPRKDWPSVVEVLYQETVADALGLSTASEPEPTASEPPASTGPQEPAQEPPEEDTTEPEPVVHTIPAGINWDEQPLGEVPDVELARKLGVSNVAVGRARRRRGINPWSPSGRGPRKPRDPGQRAGIDWDSQPLGEVPDKALARELGVDPSSVYSARKARGIGPAPEAPASEPMTKSEEAAPEPPATEPGPPPPPPSSDDPPPPPPPPAEVKPVEPRRRVVSPLIPGWPWAPPPPPRKQAQEARGASKAPEAPGEADPSPRPVSGQERPTEPHVHKCPVCGEVTGQCDDPACEPKLELADGTPMGFRTCPKCVAKLGKESSGQVVHVAGKYGQSVKL